jgi:hypothetical protein
MKWVKFLATTIKIISFLALSSCNSKEVKQIPFNSIDWKIGDRLARGQMVDYLMDKELLIGKSKMEIINLLGEPDSDTLSPINYVDDFNKKVGPFGLGGPWIFYLRIDFDTLTNKVKQVNCND